MTGETNAFADLFSRIGRADGAQLAALELERLRAFERGELTLGEVGELQIEWTIRLNQLPAPWPRGVLEVPGDLSEERFEELRSRWAETHRDGRIQIVQPPKCEVIVPVPRDVFDQLVSFVRKVAASRRRIGSACPRAEATLVLGALRVASLLAGDDDV